MRNEDKGLSGSGTEERLSRIEEGLKKLTGGQVDRPDDPERARRWDMPLYMHVLDLRETMHRLANLAQVFSGQMELLGSKLDRNAEISADNRKAIHVVTEISRQIAVSAARIEQVANVVVKEDPLLMRDLFWVDTNAVEVLLTLYLAGEAAIYLNQSEMLLRSAMFRAMATMSSSPAVWGLGCAGLAAGSAVAFISRRHRWRIMSMFADCIYFGITGIVPLFSAGAILGWLPHILACLSCAWIISRGPSRSI